jgi:fluoride exporter
VSQQVVGLGLIAGGGAIGALARYGLGGVVQKWAGPGFPWGTVGVNLLGCFLFGLATTFLISDRFALDARWRLFVLVGFMGAFTTFSTFAYETVELMQKSQWLLALGNVLLQNVIGIVALFGGIALGSFLLGGRAS